MATLNTGGRYFAMMLMPIACSKSRHSTTGSQYQGKIGIPLTPAIAAPQIMIYKTLNIHMARPYPKRAAGVAMINAIGGLSNLWASYLYFAPPWYYTAFGVSKCTLQRRPEWNDVNE